jgi:RNA polymerase-interacting CarD/CdnL/TRCF family regulator
VLCVTEPLKLLPHYRLNSSSGSLSNNTEVPRRLCRVVPGKSLTSHDRHLYNKLARRRVQR